MPVSGTRLLQIRGEYGKQFNKEGPERAHTGAERSLLGAASVVDNKIRVTDIYDTGAGHFILFIIVVIMAQMPRRC